MSTYVPPQRPAPYGPVFITNEQPQQPEQPKPPVNPMPSLHITDAEFENAAGRIEVHPVYAGRELRSTPVDRLGYGRWLTDYLTARQRGSDHEAAIRAVEAAIFVAAGQPQQPSQPQQPPPVGDRRILSGTIRAVGRHFHDANGYVSPVGSGCLYGLAEGRDPRPLLDQLAGLGFQFVRVFAGHLEGRNQTAVSARERLPWFLNEAQARGLGVEVTALTDTKAGGYDIAHHADQVARIVRAYGGTLIEIANEVGHQTQVPMTTNDFAPMRHAMSVAGYTGPVAYGASISLDELDVNTKQYPLAGGDYCTVHLARGKSPWYREACRIREQELISATHTCPVMNNEPNRVETQEQPASFAYLLGILGAGFNLGTIFHSSQVRDVQVLDGVQLEAAKAFVRGHRLLTQGPWQFLNARWAGSPVVAGAFEEGADLPGKHVWRTYSFVQGNRGYLVAAGQRPEAPGAFTLGNGWRIDGEAVDALPGVHVWRVVK